MLTDLLLLVRVVKDPAACAGAAPAHKVRGARQGDRGGFDRGGPLPLHLIVRAVVVGVVGVVRFVVVAVVGLLHR